MAEERKRVVLYPGVGVGHMAPMLELASALLLHGGVGGAFDVAVALVEPPASDPTFPGFAGAVARAKAAYSSVAFHVLPAPSSPSPPPAGHDDEHHMGRRLRFLRAMNAPLRDFLRSPSSPAPDVGALVLDMFCGDALDVAAELGVPAYFLFPSGGTGLACFLRLPAHRATLPNGFIHSDAVLTFPGAPPFRVADLPAEMRGDDAAAAAMFRMGARMPAARGILVNTFHSLEPRAVHALRDGLCVAGTPPVYCVGPLVSPGNGSDKDRDQDHHHCLRWLDAQPDRSVVFLCFGSMGAFSENQLARIANGLENSGQRFLWVVRTAGNNLSGSGGAPLPEPNPGAGADDLDALLPTGFVERTKDRGLVVSAWAPQADVLRHRATGAFVTHCGWNSVLEAVAAGLPMLCWPLYAEQRLNKVFVVDEMRLGVEVVKKKSRNRCTGDDDKEEEGDEDLVSAAEVEAKVRWVMEAEDERAMVLRERVAKARDAAAAALAEGGSSRADLLEFVRDFGGLHGQA